MKTQIDFKQKIILVFILIFLISFISASRLPIVGEDNETWGDILNDFLIRLAGQNATELNLTMVKGTNIYPSSINSTHILDKTITGNDISNNSIKDAQIDYNEVTLNDFENDANYLDKDEGGNINGDVVINGNLTLIGKYVNTTVINQYLNGSFLPKITHLFNIGSSVLRWNNIFANNLNLIGNLNVSKIYAKDWSNVSITKNQISDFGSYIETESDPVFISENSSIWNAINSKMNKSDQRFNETDLILSINTTSNIMNLGFYNKTEINNLIASKENSSFNQNLTDTLYYPIDNPLNFLNKTSADLIYAPIGYGDDWNESYANTLYLNRTSEKLYLSTYNETYHRYNSTGLIRNWNNSGYIKNWNSTGYLINWSNKIKSDSNIWINKSGVATYEGNVNVTDTLSANKGIFNRVGIGTDSPSSPLHISKNQIDLGDDVPLVYLETTGAATKKKGSLLHLYTTRGTGVDDTDLFKIYNSGGSTFLTVRNNGNVGIGTDSPSAKLDVKSSSADGIIAKFSSNATNLDPGIEIKSTNANQGWSWVVQRNHGQMMLRESAKALFPFRIYPSAPTGSLDIQSSGDIDIGNGDVNVENGDLIMHGGTIRSALAQYITLDTHPESKTTLIPYINNDIAFILSKGGNIRDNLGTSNKYLESKILNGKPDYLVWQVSRVNSTGYNLTIDLDKAYKWGSQIGVSFGNSAWLAHYVKIEVYSVTKGDWVTLFQDTNNEKPIINKRYGSDANGITKIRFTFKDFKSSLHFRIAQVWLLNYNSDGVSATHLNRGGGSLFGDIYPEIDDQINLGDTLNRWKNLYAMDGSFSNNLNVNGSSRFNGDVNITGLINHEPIQMIGYATQPAVPSSAEVWQNITFNTSMGYLNGINFSGANNDTLLINHNGWYEIVFQVNLIDYSATPSGTPSAVRIINNGTEIEGSYYEFSTTKQYAVIGQTKVTRAYLHKGDNLKMQWIASNSNIHLNTTGRYSDEIPAVAEGMIRRIG